MQSSLAGPHAIDPEQMTADERLAEVGRILGVGVVRHQAAKSSSLSADTGDSSLDFSADQRRHADGLMRGEA